jgi:arginase
MKRRAALTPTSAGAYAPGQEKAPAAFRAHGMLEAIRRAGWDVRDAGDVEGFRWRPDPQHPTAMNVEAVLSIARAVSARVADALRAGELALVLGGDCTIELGRCRCVSGWQVCGLALHRSRHGSESAVRQRRCTRLDRRCAPARSRRRRSRAQHHGSTSPDALGSRHPIPCGRPGHADAIRTGHDARTRAERNRSGRRASKSESGGSASDRLGEVIRSPRRSSRRRRALLHAFPIAESVRRLDGLTLPELATIVQGIFTATNLATLTVTEVNPDHAPDEAEVFAALITMLAHAMAGAVSGE